MTKITTLIILTIQALHSYNALQFHFEDGGFKMYEGFGQGNIKVVYFNRTERNFRGNCTAFFTGEDCQVKLTVLQPKGNAWSELVSYDGAYCDVWKNENYIGSQILEQANAPKNCPHPNGTIFNINGLYFDSSPIVALIPTGVKFTKLRYVSEIDCNGQRAVEGWVIVTNDRTDEKKRRTKPGQRHQPRK